MKRFLCPSHSHQLKTKPVGLSTDNCTVCRWIKRPWTLKDISIELRDVALSMQYCHENPDYDPFGITWVNDFKEVIKGFLKATDPSYRKTFLEELNETK